MKKDKRSNALYRLLLWDKLVVEGAKCADKSIEAYMSSGAESEPHIMAGFESASRSLQQMAMNDFLAWDLSRDDSWVHSILILYDADKILNEPVERRWLMSGYYERVAQRVIHDYTSEHNSEWKKAGINNNLGNPPE